jgi:hypothetical protein
MDTSQFSPSNFDSCNETPKEGKMNCSWTKKTKNQKQTIIENEHQKRNDKKFLENATIVKHILHLEAFNVIVQVVVRVLSSNCIKL